MTQMHNNADYPEELDDLIKRIQSTLIFSKFKTKNNTGDHFINYFKVFCDDRWTNTETCTRPSWIFLATRLVHKFFFRKNHKSIFDQNPCLIYPRGNRKQFLQYRLAKNSIPILEVSADDQKGLKS